ncbi:hypothetical protein K438DRAFT_1788752 [Mycena galopus ATCC 62051]|nr:hypothetical protein K438DRAFT_1788752 [Mycena galopus ATCC 62051]
MDIQYCSGDINGTQCRCGRFISKSSAETLCTCEHPEGYHPEMPRRFDAPATAASIVASYQDPTRFLSNNSAPSSGPALLPSTSSSRSNDMASLSKPSTSKNTLKPTLKAEAQAVAETTSGLKRKRIIDPKEEVKEVKSLKRRKRSTEELIIMGEIIIMVSESTDNNRLIFTTPRAPDIALFEARHLAVNGIRTELSFNPNWDVRAMDNWLRQKFVQYFQYIDRYHPIDPTTTPPQFQWNLLIRHNSTLTVSPHVNQDAKEISRYLSGKAQDRKIFLGMSCTTLSSALLTDKSAASPHIIPATVWDHSSGQWQMDAEEESDVYTIEQESDSNKSWENLSSGDDHTNALGKRKAKSSSRSPSIMSIPDNDDDDFPIAVDPTPPTPVIAVALSVPSPHPSLSAATTAAIARPPRTTTGYCSSYPIYFAKHFMAWSPSDLEADPHLWTRPFNEGA